MYDHKYATSKPFRDNFVKNKVANRAYMKRYVNRYKKICGCKFCEEDEPAVLDFHHRDASKKIGTISDMIKKCGIKAIKKEIRKCEVLCSNCHRKVHAGLLEL